MLLGRFSSVDMTIDELKYLIKDYGWAHFESEHLGQVTIAIRNSPLLSTGLEYKNFYLRVGLHMNRPFKAIIADGQFVRMAAAPEYADCDLVRLDPVRPSNCTYSMPRQVIGSTEIKPIWKPFRHIEQTTSHITTSYQNYRPGPVINWP